MRIVSHLLGGTAIAAFLTISAEPGIAQFNQALNAGESATRQAEQTQARINELDDQRNDLVREYRVLLQELESANLFGNQLERRLASQAREEAALIDQLDRVDEIAAQVDPMMNTMIENLRIFINGDLPFKRERRLERVATLQEAMDNPSVPPGERYRLIIQAFKTEIDYGRSVSTYKDQLEIGDETKTVDILQYGRVALVYLTESRDEAGYWDRATQSFRPLSGQYKADILKGIRVASALTTPVVLHAPVSSYEFDWPETDIFASVGLAPVDFSAPVASSDGENSDELVDGDSEQ